MHIVIWGHTGGNIMEERLRVLIVDDDVSFNNVYTKYLSKEYSVTQAYTFDEAKHRIAEISYHIIVLDIGLGKNTNTGFELLSYIKNLNSTAHVVMLSGKDDVETIQHSLTEGAIDFVSKGHASDAIIERIHSIAWDINHKQRIPARVSLLGNVFITEDPRLLNILGNLNYVTDNTDINILITGESGVGKELIARSIHDAGDPKRQFVTVNCAAITESLVESTLFGHKRGSFTGATEDRMGKFELAHNGDIFLDEVGTLSLEIQKKLLRVLQSGEIERVGSTESRTIRCRVIAATNENLEELIRKKQFRLDLYYRLRGLDVVIPPLRERVGDIDLLIDYYRENKGVTITEEVRKILRVYSWPGNVRELENAMKRMIAIALKKDRLITLRDLPIQFYTETTANCKNENIPQDLLRKAQELGLKALLERIEKDIIEEALRETNNQESCAKALKTSSSTLTRKIKEYGLK